MELKKYHLRLELEWDVEAIDEESALVELEERICRNNEVVGNIFWDGIEIEEIKDKDIPILKFCDIDGEPINEPEDEY